MTLLWWHGFQRIGLGRKQIQPARESRSVLWLHGDKFHAHALEGLACSNNGTRPHLARGYIQQQLDESSWGKWFRSAYVDAAQPQIIHGGDKSLAGRLPGQNRPPRRRKTRIATEVVCGRHGNARKNETPSHSQVKTFRPRWLLPRVPSRAGFYRLDGEASLCLRATL